MYPIQKLTHDIRKENPLYSLIAIEILKGKIKNPVQDVAKGKVSKEKVLQILFVTYDFGLIEKSYVDSFQKKLEEVA